jgi:hypothetical protein
MLNKYIRELSSSDSAIPGPTWLRVPKAAQIFPRNLRSTTIYLPFLSFPNPLNQDNLHRRCSIRWVDWTVADSDDWRTVLARSYWRITPTTGNTYSLQEKKIICVWFSFVISNLTGKSLLELSAKHLFLLLSSTLFAFFHFLAISLVFSSVSAALSLTSSSP